MVKTTNEITEDILSSLKMSGDPIGILLEAYLISVLANRDKDLLVKFQLYLSDKELISDYNWTFEDEALLFLHSEI
jgi:hypothetical protein